MIFNVFSTKFNPLGPNVNKILKDHQNILDGSDVLKELFKPGTIMVAHKRENNLKELILRGDPYSIKPEIMDTVGLGYKRCDRLCDSCRSFVDETSVVRCNATGKKYVIRKNLSCRSRNVIYVAYCTKCKKQGVGSTVCWLERLRNYKSHVNNKHYTCRIVRHFLDQCNDSDNPCRYMRFILVDVLNNVDGLSVKQIDELLLQKEKFWIGTLVTQHSGLNGTHDWNRSKRTDKEK